ncbi:Do family serine endopeptidase [Methylacidimicrobium tartarophylax]|uniref:Serine protease Do n=1 Tax=Methylacidimicrobium tartarophylax TaxID=1041768 RepID=A0A5E6MIR0_9BACT|nr:Do family serine endopeptidase [Methylacidimicrobium tartarophylax]VVM08123.1 serine protease Do [Methylacidimicrobium tartarophylax]
MKFFSAAGTSLAAFAYCLFSFPVPSSATVQSVSLASPPKQAKETSFSIQVDDSALPRQGAGLLASFAPIVKKVVPSVVQITTTQRVKAPEGWPFPFPPFFNEPPLRRFFGPPEGEDQGGRRQPPSPQPRSRRQSGLGSGVIVSPDGYILTNNHVVEVAEEIKVLVGEAKKEYAAKVIGKDPYSDIALVKIEANDLPAAVFADSDKVEVGDIVLAVGNPFALSQTVTMGIVSGKGRKDVGIEEYEDFIQTDAAINPGNSGGALVDVEGRLVGINTAIVSPGRVGNLGIGFAVPSNMARYAMQELVTHGRVIRGFLGVTISEVTPELARAFKLPEPIGALVEQVTPNAPAAQAGVKDGDVIIGYNGQKVVDPRVFRLAVSETPPGSKVSLKIWRDGKEMTVQTVLKERPSEPVASSGVPGSSEQGTFLPGVEIADLNSAARQQLEVPAEVQGVLVTSVDQEAPAARPGRNQLQPGDVILQVNHRAVHAVREALDAVKSSQGDLLLQVWSHGMTRFVVAKR